MFFNKYSEKKDGAIRGYDIRSGKVKALAIVIMVICLLIVAICLFLTMQSIQKRRWN